MRYSSFPNVSGVFVNHITSSYVFVQIAPPRFRSVCVVVGVTLFVKAPVLERNFGRKDSSHDQNSSVMLQSAGLYRVKHVFSVFRIDVFGEFQASYM